jgi:hypothetical protein
MSQKYLIANTTKSQRKKIAAEALGISTLDAQEPSDATMALVQKYIDGQMEISKILQNTIARYKVSA